MRAKTDGLFLLEGRLLYLIPGLPGMPHIERYLKIYTALTCTYGAVRAVHKTQCPIDGASITFAAPFLWPAYLLADFFDGNRQCTRRYQ